MIGIFDSGFGGLTVLNELLKQLPEYNYIYLGDNARAPYGDKSQGVIYQYTKEAIDFLFAQGCELVIVACNTASAKALRRIQREYLPGKYPNKKVLGVLIPAAEAVVEYFKQRKKNNKIVGIIATRSTIESATYTAEIHKLDKEVEIIAKATPLLVPLIEEGWANRIETKKILRKYLNPLKQKKIEALILGCTHYPILNPIIQSLLGKNIKIINTPQAVAEKLAVYLTKHTEIEKRLIKQKQVKFYTTDNKARFLKFGKKFIDYKIDNLNTAVL